MGGYWLTGELEEQARVQSLAFRIQGLGLGPPDDKGPCRDISMPRCQMSWKTSGAKVCTF